MTETMHIGARVAALPEKYQPIFGHPELSEGSSRGCEDRFVLIRECARRLQGELGRPLRVLDLGCAQGFFSLSLAAEGHQVHGVDFLDLNVDVCQALAQEHPTFAASFEHGTVEDVIARLDPDQYDLVLGLSVFHHLVHSQGIARVAGLCRKLSEVTDAGIFELALREEPLYWGPSLPHDPAELLTDYAFTRLLSRQATHLSSISRPLYFASSKFWYVGEAVGRFSSWSGEAHAYGRGTHQYSRRYYFGDKVFVKKMTMGIGGRAEINWQEFNNEVEFLRNPPASYPVPRLIAALDDASDLFLVREMSGGRLLSELIDDGSPYDPDKVVSELLEQLVTLERVGLYHNDVRCWNVLISQEGKAILIDYGAISAEATDCSWLGDLLLSFLITVKEILQRRIVPASPGREPALDFLTLPPRYRNTFIQAFGGDQARWTFAELQECLARSEPVALHAPEWTSLYSHMQQALLSYNTRLGALYAQNEHDRVELAARASLIERLQVGAQQAQDKLATLQLEAETADNRYRDLEKVSSELQEWAKDLEKRTAEAEDREKQLNKRMADREAENARLVSQISVLESELEERQRVRELSELLAADLSRLVEERDGMQVSMSELERINTQQQSTIDELQAKIVSLVQRLSRSETAGAADARRVKELQMDLSHRLQALEEARNRIRELEFAVDTLEGQIGELHTSRSWRVTAPLRWVTMKVTKRGRPLVAHAPQRLERTELVLAEDEVVTPADVAIDKQLAALDQLGSRIRKAKK
ncbi:methyltransferase domain-containing protein [Xanthomonas campestris pv. campestris]|uniref:methyltransferase domain-containing protein n=1 Tax=Xanthomonas campestris TaxID=339 RepID=UPI001F266F87|nr:methyltransferase domain-containing protein [Xanthomonas campestris]MEA9550828.1 methyltransferase domain-containing protein [Xanthomonas campestris]MEB1024871.1 methyltransferase domain-containing protein [Xanthomonas campestris pv. campestris]MEB1099024.1 methyltransferase domain-containing protein [Xanthomonas campestris pv. campestris]MEB1133388.1 methyltransferase domain-containing protein [Xanthomonas campestris pv. campestris]MEB1146423.1 methyltransferase domain-containing protein [